mmetsp:Transcript_100887/g.261091  ORF Transcript_100887/g.261091 Transcript_100887/m.261091 type:complete len:792 (+) Transcript_100887:36-2411(+)
MARKGYTHVVNRDTDADLVLDVHGSRGPPPISRSRSRDIIGGDDWSSRCRQRACRVASIVGFVAIGVAAFLGAGTGLLRASMAPVVVLVLAKDGRTRVPEEWEVRGDAAQLIYGVEGIDDASGKPNLGNGYLGASFGSKWMTVAGVFNGAKERSHKALVPAPYNFGPRIQASATALDLEKGMIEQIFHWPDAVAVQRTYFHRAWHHVAVTELNIDNTQNSEPLRVELADPLLLDSDDFSLHVVSQDENNTCIEGRTHESESPEASTVSIALCRANPKEVYLVPAHGTTRLVFPSTVWTTLDALPGPSVLEVVKAQHALVAAMPHEELERLHLHAMQELTVARIEVEGNVELAKTINASLWGILSSFREDYGSPGSPGGLVGDCYGGHAFWDAEQMIWPNLLMFHPNIAKDVLQYRFHLREAAGINAARAGKAGLKFPWESAVSGYEVSPWGPAAREIHVSGDVSLAFWRYWQASGGMQWLHEVAWPVLRGVATYFASEVVTTSVGNLAIRDVVDVDESAGQVDNSAYTNAVAKLALTHAVKAASLLLRSQDIGANWTRIAKALPIPFSHEKKLHLEHESDSDGTGLGVIMLQYPLDLPMEPSESNRHVRRNDLIYYASKQVSSSAMYWWTVAVAWLELGEIDLAAKIVDRMSQNVRGPFYAWSEGSGPWGCSNFITGAGGYLQIFWAGYAGVRLTDEALLFRMPRIPPDTSSLTLRGLTYRGSRLDVRITPATISLKIQSASTHAPALFVTHNTLSSWVPLSPVLEKSFPVEGVVQVATADQMSVGLTKMK